MTAQKTNRVNAIATTLSGTMGVTATSFGVTSASGFPAVPFYAVIDPLDVAKREYVLVDASVVGTTLTVTGLSKRYLAGSAAGSGISHAAGAVVRISPPMAQLFDDLDDRIDAAYRPGGTDVAILDGGTGASTAPGARTGLGLAIGTNVQAWSALLDAVAGGTYSKGKLGNSESTSSVVLSIGSYTDVGPSVTFTAETNRWYLIEAGCLFTYSAGDGGIYAQVIDGGATVIVEETESCFKASALHRLRPSRLVQFSAGSVTVKLQAKKVGGTGTLSIQGTGIGATPGAWLRVMDAGL